MNNFSNRISDETYRRKLMGCWLGKAVGGTLGMPHEGESGPLDLDFYRPVPQTMIANDDLDLQVVWACLLDRQAEPKVDASLFVKGWTENIHFPWDEYGVCKRNLAMGILPPLTGQYDNWFHNGMGAAIRSEIWACLAPGDPARAAAYAREDACLDHCEDGLWAEVWLAAMESAAFVEDDVHRVIECGFDYIPQDSKIREAIESTYQWWSKSGDWKEVRKQILRAYGHENFTDVIENLAFVLLGLLDGQGDFSRSICTANNCGKDTDCTAASTGAILGILNPEGIGEHWLEPIGRNLVLSKEIVGIDPPATLEGLCDMIEGLRVRLEGTESSQASFKDKPGNGQLRARIGTKDVPWFGHGWEFGRIPELVMPEMREVVFPGQWGCWPSQEIEQNALFLEFTFTLEKRTECRVMFNTPANCRVFLNGSYAFGREGGRMAPSPHRVPLHQAGDYTLAPGRHRLLAVLKKPEGAKEIEWVFGVADRGNHCQWLATQCG